MTDKAYIVANEEQEREVLEKLERLGAEWYRSKAKPTDFIPSHVDHVTKLPYVLLVENDQISWCDIEALYKFDEIVYDGRKEEQMSEKYVVSQEFMNELKEWKDTLDSNDNPNKPFVNWLDFESLPEAPSMWWGDDEAPDDENNNRLIAIIRWVNGEDVFEVEKPKKWVVRSKETDSTYCYAQLLSENNNTLFMAYSFANATRFDTKEEAESWANSHQEVVEVVDV